MLNRMNPFIFGSLIGTTISIPFVGLGVAAGYFGLCLIIFVIADSIVHRWRKM